MRGIGQRWMLAALVCVGALLLAGCQNGRGSAAPAADEPGTVWGHVETIDGSTITVSLVSDMTQERTARADAKNVYRFNRVIPGTYELTIDVDGPEQACEPNKACIGSARTSEVRTVEVKAGQTHRLDF